MLRGRVCADSCLLWWLLLRQFCVSCCDPGPLHGAMRAIFSALGALHSGQSVVGTWWHGVFSAGTHVAGPSLCRFLPSVVARFRSLFDFFGLPPLQEYAQTRPHNMSPGQKDPVQPQTAGSNYRLPAVEVRKEAFLAYFGVDACSTILFLDHIFPPYKVASFRTPRNSISGAK